MSFNGESPGATPFIAFLDLTVRPANGLRAIQFEVEPKPGSVVRPIRAKYTRAYLIEHGYLDAKTGALALPVFGLYAGFDNTVELKASFKSGRGRRLTVSVPTDAWDDPTDIYLNPTVVRARSAAQKLSYDYILLKGYVGGISPIIMDTEGAVRWVGTAGASTLSSIFYDNGIYVATGTSITRMELDGTFAELADYADLGVLAFHHNFDPGKRGILAEVDTSSAIESVVLEVDPRTGDVLETWDMNQILRDAMLAGGDDPNGLVLQGVDWFHNNAVTYQKSSDTLVVSSRENFVTGLDYKTDKIRWILGDPEKNWYQFPSLRRFALRLADGTLPPIGQHAVSFTKDKQLLLFDNGSNSLNQVPPGENRDYSAVRKYRISRKKQLAKETFTYLADPSLYSTFCGSVYEDRPRTYLIDYALTAGTVPSTILVGLTRKGELAFQYSYPIVDFCGVGWNAIPVHLEKLKFR